MRLDWYIFMEQETIFPYCVRWTNLIIFPMHLLATAAIWIKLSLLKIKTNWEHIRIYMKNSI